MVESAPMFGRFQDRTLGFSKHLFLFSKQFDSATDKKLAEAYLGFCCISMMELFAEIVNGL